ncbi:MAG TPA: acyl-phosphate glycerol 3-phosphate acyltransferase [Elusimicrobia bacterium]|nr:acyl-phosphate glycerol 3-phosphate acyltransferase [Elusimicrobiota bacterium]
MNILLLAVLSYLSGSIPTGYIAVRLLKGADIRTLGSGNPGATNVLRVAGRVPGIITLLIDALKGFVPVMLAAKIFFPDRPALWLLAGLCAISGHIWTVFLNFRGGKGVATAAGVFLALLPVPTLTSVIIFALILAVTKKVSLGSIISALCLPAASAVFKAPWEFTAFAALAAAAIVYKHKSNIKRLLNGTENKINFSSKGGSK